MKDDYSQTVSPHRPPFSAGKDDASLSSSSLSVRDVMRQRYSVTWHPRLLYLIVSDGYMATVMRVLHRPSPVTLLKMLLKDTTADLEKLSEKLCKSQVVKKQTLREFRVRCWFLFFKFFLFMCPFLQCLTHFQVQVRSWLDSVSCLNLESSLEALNSTSRPSNSTISAGTDVCTLPLFLQDLGASGGTTGLLEKVQVSHDFSLSVTGRLFICLHQGCQTHMGHMQIRCRTRTIIT